MISYTPTVDPPFTAPPADHQSWPVGEQPPLPPAWPQTLLEMAQDAQWGGFSANDNSSSDGDPKENQRFLNEFTALMEVLERDGVPLDPQATKSNTFDDGNTGWAAQNYAFSIVGRYYNQPRPSAPIHHATTGLPYITTHYNHSDSLGALETPCLENFDTTPKADDTALWSKDDDDNVLSRSTDDMELVRESTSSHHPKPFQVQLPPENVPPWPTSQPPIAGYTYVTGIGAQRDLESGLTGKHTHQHLFSPYKHSKVDRGRTHSGPPLACPPEDTLVNAGSQKEASPRSTHFKNNDSNTEHPGDTTYSSAFPATTTAVRVSTDRKQKKRDTDKARNRAHHVAHMKIKKLFPSCDTFNSAKETAIKVIWYLMSNDVIPMNMDVVDSWALARGLEVAGLAALNETMTRATPKEFAWPHSEAMEAHRKMRKKEADQARNAVKQVLTRELVGMFGRCEIAEALDLAFKYLMYSKANGKGRVPIADTDWRESSIDGVPFFSV